MNEQMLPIAEVAKILHSTPLNVLMHIRKGLLVGIETNSGWEISRASLDALLIKTDGGKAELACASGCAPKHACGGGCCSS
ncbi:MAG: hypothetical protein P8Y73_06830 [Desulfuromonadales bacterium]|jgi:hypothetical protein